MKDLGELASAATFFAGLTIAVDEGQKHSLEEACKIVEAEAKHELGTYQGAAGPFDAWPALAESTKAQRVAQGYSADEPGLRSGAMRDSIEHTVISHEEAEVGSNDDHLFWFELGTSKQPPRSVLGIAAIHSEEKVVHTISKHIVGAIEGKPVIGSGELP